MASDQTQRKVIDLVIALAPIVAIVAVQYRDELTQARMWVEAKLNHRPDLYVPHEWVRQVYDDVRKADDAD